MRCTAEGPSALSGDGFPRQVTLNPRVVPMSVFVTSRTFAATPAAVFAALAAPERLARWWGPAGFRNTFDVFEFTPGGRWRFTMHGPDGTAYPNESMFVAIEPTCSVIVDHTCLPHFRLTIRLTEVAGGTLVSWEQVFANAEFAASIKHIVEPANEQNLDRWQAEVGVGG
jgi:uncharacterized protein YndB with AHSA1/START domain